MAGNFFDALVVGDSRFSGGSTAALVSDVTTMSRLGMSVGLLFVRSAYLDDSRDKPNPKALGLADLEGVSLLTSEAEARSDLAFLHHPNVFYQGIEEALNLSASRAILVTHHAPFRADGSLEWDPIATLRRAKKETGLSVWFAPISGVVRAQLTSFAPIIRQTSADWPNIFDAAEWDSSGPVLERPEITIGRHGRADALKFPATGPEIDASLPASKNVKVRVLGCPTQALIERGAHPEAWDVLSFGAEPVVEFLNSLDVFTYHYHPNWLEAFGRTIVEAALCGRPCLLDPRLRSNFGDMATFCKPLETSDALNRMAEDRASTRAKAKSARELAIARYSSATMQERISALKADPGDASRGAVSASPPTVLRKLAGHYLRRAKNETG